jgi:hypothetical protein
MILSIVVILLVGAVAFFHYIQGLFSATLSVIFAIVAAAVAVGWQETIVDRFLAGRYADQANAMVVCVVFAAVYLILRIIADRFISGNVRVPVMADKVGAGIMGLIAGLIAVGVLVFAAQSLPFTGFIAGYSRLALSDQPRSVIVPPAPGQRQFQDARVFDELQVESLNGPLQMQSLILPADDFMLGTVSRLSSGSLSYGDRDLSSIHPDWLLELFGQRLGIEPGVRHTALNNQTQDQVKVNPPLVMLPSIKQIDGEVPGIRTLNLDPVRRPDGDHSLLVVVVTFDKSAADQSDLFVRFSPASVRLVGNGKNYFPVGTIDATGQLVVNKPDDFLVASAKERDPQVAFLFDVVSSDIIAGESARSGVFLEVKRLARQDLTGMPVEPRAVMTVADGVMRKPVVSKPKPAPAVPASPATAPAGVLR